jgi:hypothetical protein
MSSARDSVDGPAYMVSGATNTASARPLLARSPSSWLCGVSSDDEAALPLRDNPADWMAVTRSAVRDLINMGFDRVCLIMADSGPMDQCDEHHLNQTVPAWMTELDAVYIPVRGWDHRRNSWGRSVGRGYLSLQQQAPEHWNRFSLDPALWRIDVLAGILDILLTNEGLGNHGAWAFERDAGRLHEKLPKPGTNGLIGSASD